MVASAGWGPTEADQAQLEPCFLGNILCKLLRSMPGHAARFACSTVTLVCFGCRAATVVATEATELLVIAVEDYRRHLQVSPQKQQPQDNPARPPHRKGSPLCTCTSSPCYVRSWLKTAILRQRFTNGFTSVSPMRCLWVTGHFVELSFFPATRFFCRLAVTAACVTTILCLTLSTFPSF